jgi:hypothetical protein
MQRIALTLAVCGPPACTLLSDLNELSGARDASAALDAGPEATTADTALDVTHDVVTDVTTDVASDASADTAIEASADSAIDTTTDATSDGSLSPCTSTTFDFCVDFDDGLLSHWSSTEASPTGALEIGNQYAVSPPSSLRALLAARPSTAIGSVASRLKKNFNQSWKKTVIELDVRVTAPAWLQGDSNVNIVSFVHSSDTTYYGVYVDVAKDGVVVDFDGDGKGWATGPVFAYNTWTHTTIELSPTGARVTYGGNSLDFPHAVESPGANPYTLLLVGVVSGKGPHPEIEVFYDNVSVAFTN